MLKMVLFLLLSVPCYAINLNLFKPAQSQKFTLTESAMSISSNKSYVFGAFYQFINNPIISTSKLNPNTTTALVGGMNILNFSATRVENKFFQWGLTGAAVQTKFNANNSPFSLGDSSIYLKYFFPKDYKGFHFSLIPQIHLPTGKAEYFSSDTSTGYEFKLAVEKSFKLFNLSLNLGYLSSKDASYLNLNYSSRILMSLGLYVPITDRLGVVGEVITARTLPFNNYQNPGVTYSGVRYKIGNIEILSGISFGNLSNTLDKGESNNFSFSGGLRFTPNLKHSPVFKINQLVSKQLLRLSDKIYFAQDSINLNSESKTTLDKISDLIKSQKFKFRTITLQGHANQDGTKLYNQELSLNRAKIVKEYFVSNGLSANKFKTIGVGEYPVQNNMKKNVTKIQNRKVIFYIE